MIKIDVKARELYLRIVKNEVNDMQRIILISYLLESFKILTLFRS